MITFNRKGNSSCRTLLCCRYHVGQCIKDILTEAELGKVSVSYRFVQGSFSSVSEDDHERLVEYAEAIHQAAAKTNKNNEAQRTLRAYKSIAFLEQSGKREARAQTQRIKVRTTGLQQGASLQRCVFTTSVTLPVLDFNKVVATSDKVSHVKLRDSAAFWIPSAELRERPRGWSPHSFPTFPPWL